MEVDCGGGNQHVANSIGEHDVASAAPGVCTTTTATAFSTAAIHRPAATPSRWTTPFDINSALQQEMRPPALSSERPSGHDIALGCWQWDPRISSTAPGHGYIR